MKRAAAAFILFAIPFVNGQQPPAPVPPTPSVTLPATLQAERLEWFILKFDVKGGQPKWAIDAGLTEIDMSAFGVDTTKSRAKVFKSSKPGTYKVIAWNAAADVASDWSTCVVTITGQDPGPGPAPGPGPTDPLTAALQAAFTADTATDKASSLVFLQKAYTYMAANVPATAMTNAAVAAWMKTIVDAPNGLTPTQLAGMRKVIAVELGQAWGTTTEPLANTAAELQKIAMALEGVR
jgi:hypothetical protein